MGVFSVIEKDRYHRSNIYSSAPMPYMQRITWSGVAMHEGVGLGHPASHGCIRMPHEFAARLFLLHSIGARVIIARPELKLAEIADPHLFVHKTAPPPGFERGRAGDDGTDQDRTIDRQQQDDGCRRIRCAGRAGRRHAHVRLGEGPGGVRRGDGRQCRRQGEPSA